MCTKFQPNRSTDGQNDAINANLNWKDKVNACLLEVTIAKYSIPCWAVGQLKYQPTSWWNCKENVQHNLVTERMGHAVCDDGEAHAARRRKVSNLGGSRRNSARTDWRGRRRHWLTAAAFAFRGPDPIDLRRPLEGDLTGLGPKGAVLVLKWPLKGQGGQILLKLILILHCVASGQSWYFVKHFGNVPLAVGLTQQLLCRPIGDWNFRKKT